MAISSHKARILTDLDIPCVMQWPRQARRITWRKSIVGTVKLNLDGCSFGNPSPFGSGGVTRDEFGKFMTGFTTKLGEAINAEAELGFVLSKLNMIL